MGLDLEGLTLSLVGLGRLGAKVAQIGRALGMKVIAWSENLTPARCEAAGAEYVSREDLFRRADFLSIHLQLSPRTRGFVTAADLGLMQRTAYLINTSRGPIVDEAALIAALREKRIAGAGLDVSTSSRCRSIILSVSSTMSCSPRISATSPRKITAPISPAWSRTSAPSSTARRCAC